METWVAIREGLFKEVRGPAYGRQDIGHSPGGPQDRFSVALGNALLDNPVYAPALEIVFPPVLECLRDCCFVLVGAKCRNVTLHKVRGDAPRSEVVAHAVVTFAGAGDHLEFGEKEYGFRSYLCYAPFSPDEAAPLGRQRGNFDAICSWLDTEGRIRVTAGPEYPLLADPNEFLNLSWFTTNQMSDMGIHLRPASDFKPWDTMPSLISGAVNDGTIQATPTGPIVLLRNRQTIGGYPRIFNVVGVDVDRLAQYGPEQIIRFRQVSIPHAAELAARQQADLERFRRHGSPA